jgi:serine/threonine protein kinase
MAMAANPGRKTSAPIRIAGRYELREKLGEGGMGVVWRALDTKTSGEVAIKIMKDISDPDALELFTKEWRALAEMSHPNIVDVRDVDVLVEDGEQKPFFVMPLLRGATLSDLIGKSSERLTIVRVVEILSQVCRGLQAAHQRGLVHRDLKPSNIFVMDDDTAKVIDFGVVYLAGTQSITGQKGTFQYMSPEQVQMKEVTRASDIFALGVILYEALTARKPFACTTADDTMQAVLKRIPPSVSELNPGIPHSISQVVHKCLAKQPIHRFSSARELSETLQKAFRNEPVFDSSKLRLRVERAKSTFKTGDEGFASELLSELESEGHLDPDITVLRMQIDMSLKQKKIRQLLQSARARIEQDEIPLGLDKLRELIELDPDNSEALALRATTEKQRSEAQAGKWIELANTHLDNYDFSAARQSAQEALTSRPGDPRALVLLSRIDSIELEAKRVREQKEQLYNTAMKAYQNGEIDSAMSRLVRLFSVVRSRPAGSVPERDAIYESFYKVVRSEHDSIHSLLEEAQHQFSVENLAQALAICAEHLTKYPNDGAFQALKIQIEDADRQKVSAYIATVSRNADAEPDLDRRANILREACERYPGEAQFAQQLKVVRERRDLINSIVAKAHQFAEKGQYSEELSQWDMLRNIHPRYPGLGFELEQCKKKRDQQAHDEDKAHLVEEIVSIMETQDFTKAQERTKLALLEFPGDAEILGLEKLSIDGLERSREANRLCEAGQAEAATNNWTDATDLLQRALRLDPRNAIVMDGLINVLTEQARNLLQSDWPQADRLHREASALDANHRAVRALGIEISAARRLTYVGECLTQARALVAVGDSAAAYERIREGRKEYPKDVRLEQFEASLLKESKELQLHQERLKRLEDLGVARQRLERDPDSEKARNVLKLSQDLSAQDPDDPDAMRGVAEAEQTVKRVMNTDDLSYLLRAPTDVSRKAVHSDSVGPATGPGAAEEDDATKIYERKPPKGAARKAARSSPQRTKAWISTVQTKLGNLSQTSAKTRKISFFALGTVALIVAAFFVFHHRSATNSHEPVKVAADTKVHLSATPADSSFKIDGVQTNEANISVPAGKTVTVEVSRLGYTTARIQLDGKVVEQRIALEPQSVRITVATVEKSGDVQLDGNNVGTLVDGFIDGLNVPSDGKSHTLVLTVKGRRVANLEFQANPGERPLLAPIASKDMVVVSSLGTTATIYGGEQLKNAKIGGAQVSLANAGTDLPPVSDQHNELTIQVGSSSDTLTLAATEWPSLTLRSLGAGSAIFISSNVGYATLTANGIPVKRGRKGWRINEPPGTYEFVLSAEGYETQTWKAVLGQGQTLQQEHKLEAKVAQPKMSTLTIAGGTVGAQVILDGTLLAGKLDVNGTASFPASLSVGDHKIQFREEGYCESPISEVVANPPADTQLQGGKLEPCGSITVQAGLQQASIKVRRAGDANTNWIELSSGKKTTLPVGVYDAQANSPDSSPVSKQINVEAGRNADFAPQFLKLQHCQLEDAAAVTLDGDWMKAKNSGRLIYFSPGCVNVNLVIAKPKGLLSRKRVEWDLEAPGGAGRVQYELDNDKLARKAVVQHPTDNVEKTIKEDSAEFKVHIRVDGSHIKVTDEKGEILDDYIPQEPVLHDLSSGRLGLKTTGEFKFSWSGQ